MLNNQPERDFRIPLCVCAHVCTYAIFLLSNIISVFMCLYLGLWYVTLMFSQLHLFKSASFSDGAIPKQIMILIIYMQLYNYFDFYLIMDNLILRYLLFCKHFLLCNSSSQIVLVFPHYNVLVICSFASQYLINCDSIPVIKRSL